MRWVILLHMILIIPGILRSQTYVIKFVDSRHGTGTVQSILQESVANSKNPADASLQFTVLPLVHLENGTNSQFPWEQYVIVRFSDRPGEQLLQQLSSNGLIEYVQESLTYRVQSIPNDSAFSSQWNLRKIGVTALWNSNMISQSIPKAIVGVIDTGIDPNHPDLKNSLYINSGEYGSGKESNGIDDDGNGYIDDWQGYDFVNLPAEDQGDWSHRDNEPFDEHGHGTSVSGIIGAESNNGIGITGIAPSRLMPLRAFGKNGNGNDIDIAIAIVYAADNNADVLNMSFGDVVPSRIMHDAIRYAHARNVILVASSGNDGSNLPHYPSDFPEVISTGSVNAFDSRSFFSSNSPSLDIMAPGEAIVTTTLNGGYTNQFSGTSAAAPHVAGAAALIKSFETQKSNSNPGYQPLTNEEITGLLLNSATDAGKPGWDEYYGAGIINVQNALSALGGTTVKIHSPSLDEHLPTGSVPIVITALSPYLKSLQVSYGAGDQPVEWVTVKNYEQTFFSKETIAYFNTAALKPNVYVIRLTMKSSRGSDLEVRQRVYVDTSAMKVLSFRYRDSVIINKTYGTLIEARLSRNSYGVLYYKKAGESSYNSLPSFGFQKNHSFVISSELLQPSVPYEVYCEFTDKIANGNTVRFPTFGSAGFDHFNTTLSGHSIYTGGFEKKNFSLPKGFLLNEVQIINGNPFLILNGYDADNNFGNLKLFEYSNGTFSLKDTSVSPWVPRAFQRTESGNVAFLAQDRGVSRLFIADTVSSKYFQQSVWGDSTDVWASRFVDLDGDAKPEIIARSSSEYLIYKNLGNNAFTVASRLKNPSTPLPGEASNQFGPPRALVGDFTQSSRREIVFADYDGDILLYRQKNAHTLEFDLAGIDSSGLQETSDYLVSGDFNGDGIPDFAVAGHSSLDYNQDREYDAPVWTIRVFSHLPANAPGTVTKIWEQHFFGIKSGSAYDNGLSSGKLRTSDQQDALFVSLNPWLYIFEWNSAKNTFESKWIHPSQSNAVIVTDLDGDLKSDLGFHTNGKTEFWTLTAPPNITGPYSLSAIPVSGSRVRLQWSSSNVLHDIYRGTHRDSLAFIASVSGTSFLDTAVANNTSYIYSVTISGNIPTPASPISIVETHDPATIVAAEQHSRDQIKILMSRPIDASSSTLARFKLGNAESSSALWASDRSFLVTFPSTIPVGNHPLKILFMRDAGGMEGDTSHSFNFNATAVDTAALIIRSFRLLSSQSIQIEFSGDIDMTKAKNASFYSLRNSIKSFTVTSVDSVQPNVIRINVAQTSSLTQLALRLEVSVSSNVISKSGEQLNGGKGQSFSISQEQSVLSNIILYPNPVRNSQKLSFVNIPPNCKISIYSSAGERVRVFDRLSTIEGFSWDMKNDNGEDVATGVYIYRVEQLDAGNAVANTTMGKFAVIR